jgi:NAD(P)-dependent dehydrogenase (short-subunit alcohol dehydrogenase family)
MSEGDFTAVVTGTSSGIGFDIAKRMLDRGWRVIGLSIDKTELCHDHFEGIIVDLLNEEQTAAVAKHIAARHAVTHLVHNAGLIWPNLLDAIHGMARTWALELGPDGITVNVVAPGPILTDNFWSIIPKDSERQQKIADQLPVRRIGTVEDVSRAVLFFAEPEASYVTGQVLFVCGGSSLGGLSL